MQKKKGLLRINTHRRYCCFSSSLPLYSRVETLQQIYWFLAPVASFPETFQGGDGILDLDVMCTVCTYVVMPGEREPAARP